MHSSEDNPTPQVSVIVPVVDDPERLRACLDALAAQESVALEAIVVDNGSRLSPRPLVESFPFARMLEEPSPGSYQARNYGAAMSRGLFLAFTDADCRPRADWLAEALRHFNRDMGIAAIGGRIALEHSRHASAAEAYERVYAFRQDRYVRQHGFAATANLIVRREAFLAVGGFDGSLRSGGDYEWGRRLVRSGYRLEYADNVVVEHPARARLSELVRKRRRLAGGWMQRPTSAVVDVPGLESWRETQPRGWHMLSTLALRPEQLGLHGLEGWKVIGILGILALVDLGERLRLALGRAPIR